MSDARQTLLVALLTLPLLSCGRSTSERSAREVFAAANQSVLTVRSYVEHIAWANPDTENIDDLEIKKEKVQPPAALGSAVVIEPTVAVTNCHVLAAGVAITVAGPDGKEFGATLDAYDMERDLCILKIPKRIQSVSIRAFDTLKIGEPVFTIGSPAGLSQSIGEGIISGLRSESDSHFIQTTAPISPGSSGGGLFDSRGRLIGITTFKIRESEQLNFAIASDAIAQARARFLLYKVTRDKAEEQYKPACDDGQARELAIPVCIARADKDCVNRINAAYPGDDLAAGRAWTKLDPWSVRAWSCLAKASRWNRNYDESVAAAEEAVELRPVPLVLNDAATAYVARARSRSGDARRADAEKARSYTIRSTRANPHDAEPWSELAWIYALYLCDKDSAIGAAMQAAQLDEKYHSLPGLIMQRSRNC